MSTMKIKIQVGKKYFIREFPSLNLPDLHKVKIVNMHELGDGSTVVSFTYNFPFLIREQMYLEDFLNNLAVGEFNEVEEWQKR